MPAEMPPVGDALWVVTIARHGTRDTLRSDVFLNFAHYRQPDDPIVMDYFVWVLTNGERTIVVDTGYSREGAESRGRDVLVEVPELFAKLGVDPAAAPLVIVSHAHYDHIGNLDHFPASRYLVARREVDFWGGPNGRKPLFHHSVEDRELHYLSDAAEQGRVDFFEDAIDVAPGVRVLEVGGHTPGQSVVLVDTAEGRVLLASDAVHYYEELDADMPFISVTDVVGMYDAFQRIRDLVADGSVRHVVSGHDPSTLSRFRAAEGELAGLVATIGAQP